MDRVLELFERHKYGIIGTLVVHSLVLLAMGLARLPGPPGPEGRSEMRVQLLDEPPPDATNPDNVAATAPDPIAVTNLISDLNAKVREAQAAPTVGPRASERMENDLHAFEQREFDRLAEERRNAGKEVVVPELDPSKWAKEQYLPKKEAPARTKGPTTVSYDLKGRQAEALDVPAYLCTGSGRVVVRIGVDRSGRVQRTAIDKAATNATEPCMLDYALTYAGISRFDHSVTAPDEQIGTITFLFLPQ